MSSAALREPSLTTRRTGTNSAGLGAAFTAAVQRVLDQIAAQPDFYPQVYQDVREALVSGYPYCVYYREEPGQVVVLSVFHGSRDPSIWQGRA